MGLPEVLGWRINGNKRSTLDKARRKEKAFLAKGSRNVRIQLRVTLGRLHQKGIDPYYQRCPVVVDNDVSKPHWMKKRYVALPHAGQGFNMTLRT
ncbi:MAG: hypothetical protein ACKPKO_36035 [Candidatus Fonsibacter sp.]